MGSNCTGKIVSKDFDPSNCDVVLSPRYLIIKLEMKLKCRDLSIQNSYRKLNNNILNKKFTILIFIKIAKNSNLLLLALNKRKQKLN